MNNLRNLALWALIAVLLVVLFNNLTPRRASSAVMAWLNAEVVTPISKAARRKLRCLAIAIK